MKSGKTDNLKATKGYKFCLYKAYFEKGYSITSILKYMIALFGISSLNVKLTLLAGFGYAIFCFFLGWWWYKYRFITAELEVQNQFNLFVKEMRNRKI